MNWKFSQSNSPLSLNFRWRMIVGQQKGKKWGKAIVEQLALDLQREFPGIQGFSARNIWYMRNFYLCYANNNKLQPLVAAIGWTHNLIIMERCKDDLEREFHIRMTRTKADRRTAGGYGIKGKF